MALIRHCDMCNMAMEDPSVFIKVSFETNSNDLSGLVVGLPFPVEGDYCGMGCLSARLKQMMERE